MPPETKPVISSLAEMTCENCVYSVWVDHISLLSIDVKTGQPIDKVEKKRICRNVGNNAVADDYFCSKGKWMVYSSYDFELMDEKETHPSNYDNCYYMFGRGK